MEAVLRLFVMLLGISHGVENYCDGKQDGAQCYGALGGTVVVQLMDSISGIARFEWKKEKTDILKMTVVNIFIYNNSVIKNRSFFTPSNGTLRISNLIRNDSGEYTLEIFNENGKQTEQRTLHLSVQAPVSSVQLVSECLSQGEMRVSCSSEGGDSLQYSWTLDGRTLTDTELHSGNFETNIITLKQNVSGHLVCSVRNHISSVSRGEMITPCEPQTMSIVAGVLSALVIFLVIGVAVICTQKKKKNHKPKEEENEHELTYADVKIVQRQERQVKQRVEEEVEYGQVKISERPRRAVEPKGDDCVYAKDICLSP